MMVRFTEGNGGIEVRIIHQDASINHSGIFRVTSFNNVLIIILIILKIMNLFTPLFSIHASTEIVGSPS